MTSHVRVGFLGVGTMGGAMAANAARAGHDVVAFDRSEEALERVAASGVRPAETVAAAALDRDIVHVVVFTDEQVTDATLGNDADPGAISVMSPGAVLVVHSTVQPQTIQQLTPRARDAGVHVIDASMTGTAAAAIDGTLTLLVGGDSMVLDGCRPELASMSETVIHVGGLGMGSLAKIMNNFLVLANAEALRECLTLALEAGMDPGQMLAVVNASTGRSWVSEHWDAVRPTVDDVPDPHNLTPMSVKDCALALGVAARYGTPLAVGRVVADRLPNVVRPRGSS